MSVSRALCGIAIRSVGPDLYYILARTTAVTPPPRRRGGNEIDAGGTKIDARAKTRPEEGDLIFLEDETRGGSLRFSRHIRLRRRMTRILGFDPRETLIPTLIVESFVIARHDRTSRRRLYRPRKRCTAIHVITLRH